MSRAGLDPCAAQESPGPRHVLSVEQTGPAVCCEARRARLRRLVGERAAGLGGSSPRPTANGPTLQSVRVSSFFVNSE